jgi:Xaa-Pro aminopeptidase
VFNIEPAVYIPGHGGMRHCNMVAVTENGAELLTPFLDCREELIVA